MAFNKLIELVSELDKNSEITFYGLKILPKAVFFKNLIEGKTYKQKIRLQNIIAKPIIIRTILQQPCSFKLENSLNGTSLSSGLTAQIWIKYTHVQNSNITATLRIYVNEECMYYPINVCMSFSYMYPIPRIINFGKINQTHSIYTETLEICNKGFKTSKFAFDLANNPLGLLIKPIRGFVEPNSSTFVQISVVGIEEGQFYKEIWVKCDYPFRFAVAVDVIKPKLYILSPQIYTESFLPIQFPATYAMCKNYKTLLVKNHNLLESNYIVVPEFHLDVMAMHKVKELEPSYSSFCFLPAVDGYLKPNEKKELHVSFQAKKIPSQKRDRIFFVCYRLLRLEIVNVNKLLQVKAQKKRFISISEDKPILPQTYSALLESGSDMCCVGIEDDSRSLSQVFGDTFVNNYELNNSKSFDEYIRLCCYAVVKPVQVDVHPRSFELGSVDLNSTKTIMLTLHNRSNLLPIYYEYVKTAYVDVVVPKGMLDVSQSVEIAINISPKRSGILDGIIRFNLLYYSYVDVGHREMVKVGKLLVGLQMNVRFPVANIQSKFNPGITPVYAHEVGFLTDNVKFNTEVEKPKMAILGSYELDPNKKYDDAKIAFPNDRRRSNVPWTKTNGRCKTLFTGVSRGIVPNDLQYARTSQEELQRLNNIHFYDKYINRLHMKRIEKLPPPMLSDYYACERKLLLKINKPICPTYVKNSNDPILQGFPALTPSQTYFINVKPLKVNLGKIAVNSTSVFRLTISNDNKFPCHVELKTLHMDDCVFPSLPRTIILKASLSTVFEEVFHPIVVGKFHTILNFYINNRHSLPITFQAEIVKPFVYFDTHSIIFDDKDGTHSRYLKLMNTLNVPLVFYWQIPKLTCYSVLPSQGCIPVRRFIMCEVIYKPDAMKRSSARLQCCCSGGANITLEVNAYLLKCDVEYLKDKVVMDNMPINIPVVEYNTLRNNATESVSFTIRNTKPCHGVSIEPAFGTIWGKSDFAIKITVYFKYFVKFDCRVETEFDHGNYLTFQISGCVDFPKLRLKSDNTRFTLKRIPAESFDVCPFSLFNRGNSELNLSFDQVLFPEIKISRYADYLDTSEELEINLAPDEMVELFVHFYPLDVCMNEFLVPVIINHILGPPYKGEPDTLKAPMYVDEFTPKDVLDGTNECVHLIKGRTHILPVISIYAISSRHVLRFNKTFFKFKYFPLKTYPSKTVQELKIKNSFHKAVEFSLNVDALHPHFEITPSNKNWNYCNNFMFCTAEPNEEMVLIINFKHPTPGFVTKRIEVYIKDIKNGAVFTYIKLRGRYLEATLKIPQWIFLEPVPVRVILENEVKLKMRNHLPNCKLIILCDDKDFMVTELPSKVEYSLIKDVTVKIEFVSDVVKQICTKIYFTCSCGAKAHTIVTASADENIATIYTHFLTNSVVQPSSVKSKYFPLFPSKAENTKLAIYMRKCKTIVERWIYEQAMHMTYYYFIPDSMMGLYKYNTKPKATKPDILVIVKIVQNVCGTEVLPLLITRPYPSEADRIEQINYKHSVFKNVLEFLKSHGAFFPHVRARYLLDYNEYVIYCTKVRTVKQKKVIEYDDYDEHYLRSEQCWLDLILQLFKSVVLASITFRKQRVSQISDILTLERIHDIDSQQALLQWLNDIYDSQIDVLMSLDEHKPPNFKLPPRNIQNFTSDLEDGLVLVAITMYYCPYLRFILKDIYVNIDSVDKSYHNAVLLIQAWSMVKCSFQILPEEIASPFALQMLLFVTYMYLVFPLLTPKEELTFNVSLSYTESREILIKNPSSLDLVFEISFLNNIMDCFQIIPCNVAVVHASKDIRLKVLFQAKRLKNITAVLVLAGDTPGQTYSKSIIYILKGITNFYQERERITLSVDLYSMVERDILFRAPYECETTYNLVKEKCKLEDFNLEVFKTWKRTSTVIVPKSLFCSNNKMTTNELGIGTVTMTVCCLSIAVEELLLVFMNETVGDFIVTLIIQPMNFQKIPKHIISITLPDNWELLTCICEKNKFVHNSKCPRYVTIHIPCRNDYFWNVITQSLLLAVSDDEKPIWMDYLNGEMGPYLLNWLFVTANEPASSVKHIFESDIVYKVSNPYHFITLPSTVTIPNMRSNETVPLDLHIGPTFPLNKYCDFTLQSEDGGEYRIYSLILRKIDSKLTCTK